MSRSHKTVDPALAKANAKVSAPELAETNAKPLVEEAAKTKVKPLAEELAAAKEKLTAAELENRHLRKQLREREEEIADLKLKLKTAEERAAAAEEEFERVVPPLRKEVETLRQRVSELEGLVEEMKREKKEMQAIIRDWEERYKNLEKQLGLAMESTHKMHLDMKNLQHQVDRNVEENRSVKMQLQKALRDLTGAKDLEKRERERRIKAEDKVLRVERALEEMTLQLEEREKDVEDERAIRWNSTSQLWKTAALTAAGTATVVSLIFLKYHSNL